jgi:hypothetical protein
MVGDVDGVWKYFDRLFGLEAAEESTTEE